MAELRVQVDERIRDVVLRMLAYLEEHPEMLKDFDEDWLQKDVDDLFDDFIEEGAVKINQAASMIRQVRPRV